MKSDCRQYFDKIPALIAGELVDQERDELFAHMGDCADCTTRYKLLTKVSDLDNDADLTDTESADILTALSLKVQDQRRAHNKIQVFKWSSLAAAAVILVVFLNSKNTPPEQSPEYRYMPDAGMTSSMVIDAVEQVRVGRNMLEDSALVGYLNSSW